MPFSFIFLLVMPWHFLSFVQNFLNVKRREQSLTYSSLKNRVFSIFALEALKYHIFIIFSFCSIYSCIFSLLFIYILLVLVNRKLALNSSFFNKFGGKLQLQKYFRLSLNPRQPRGPFQIGLCGITNSYFSFLILHFFQI